MAHGGPGGRRALRRAAKGLKAIAIQAVICDFGGVLTTPLDNCFTAWSRESGIPLEDVGTAMAGAAERHGEHPLFMLEKGQIDESEFVRRLEAELGGGRRVDTMAEVYFLNLERNHEMIAFMRELRDRGLRTALLTNNVREWEATWRAMLPEIDEIFEVVVDSAFVGMRKPDPEIYALTLERLGVGDQPGECVFVDDVDVNCQAARELGMHAVQFHDAGQAIDELERLLRDAD